MKSAEPSAVYHARHEKYACAYTRKTHAVQIRSYQQLLGNSETHGLATSVGSVFGKPGLRTRPSCYFYCLHRARNEQNLVEVSHAH